ncbi:MAG TPA: TlpA disulfide reductase family protein [Anaerolineaceae bacterium]|nr:TlpA disulfide reductase family protein [Anaerolineaceae bacterium]
MTQARNPKPGSANSEGKRFPLWMMLIGLLLAGLLAVLGLWLKQTRQEGLEVGTDIPDFGITTFSGEHYQISELAGRVILLNFWSSWCASCDEEGAILEEVWQEVKDSGDTIFLGVNYVDTEKDSIAFLEKYGITFPNGPDMGSRISRIFKVEAVPETYIIGRDGTLTAVKIGPFQSADEIRAILKLAD